MNSVGKTLSRGLLWGSTAECQGGHYSDPIFEVEASVMGFANCSIIPL